MTDAPDTDRTPTTTDHADDDLVADRLARIEAAVGHVAEAVMSGRAELADLARLMREHIADEGRRFDELDARLGEIEAAE